MINQQQYNYAYLQQFCEDNKIELVDEYSKENKMTRISIIQGKCKGENCGGFFKKSFRQLFETYDLCTSCLYKQRRIIQSDTNIYSVSSLLLYCNDNNITLTKNYIEPIGRETKIEGKCKNIECVKIFTKKFRMLIISNGYCEDCTNNNKAKKVSISRIESRTRIDFENSLASHPRNINFSKKNGENIDMKYIPLGTHEKYIFDCDVCNHEFITSPAKISIGRWCPYCCIPQKKLCGSSECKKCFDKSCASNIKMIENWSTQNQNKPEFIFKNGDTTIFLDCDKCNRTFDMRSKSIENGHWCRFCINKTEKILYEKLIEYFPSIIAQFSPDWINPKRYDFCILEYKIIIELDGEQHFRQVWNWKSPDEQQTCDKFKQECANKNGYSIIRILQADVFNDKYDWKTELINNIEKIKKENIIKNVYMCKNNEYEKFIN